MREERKTEIKVGITVVAAILILLAIISWARNISLSAGRIELNISFPSAEGLERDDNVTVNGVRKGFVENIQINDKNVIITISLDGDVKLHKDAAFRITMLDIMGGKKIDIFPGTSNEPLDLNSVPNGEISADIAQVLAIIGNLQDQLPTMVAQVETTLISLNNLLTDKKISEELKSTITNLNQITNDLSTFIRKNQDNFNQLTQNTLSLTNEMNELVKSNKENITLTLNETKDLIQKTNELTNKLNSLLSETSEQNNNLGKILYDENLINDIKITIKNGKELIKILEEQLKKDGVKVKANIDLF
ncbi:MAG: hypothetical protein STSR0008_08000 [Ignavibacterium sp.]